MTVIVNGATRQLPPNTLVETVVADLAAPATGTAVALNEEVLPRTRWADTRLVEGDRLEVLTAVQGG
ncbi:MAG: sulfur carrier protein ThiS [Mycobacteriales bacterium]